MTYLPFLFEYPLTYSLVLHSENKMATVDVITTIIRRNRPGTKAAVSFRIIFTV